MYVPTRCLSVLQTEYRFTPAGYVGRCYRLHERRTAAASTTTVTERKRLIKDQK